MFKDHPIRKYLIYSVIAAISYFIVTCIFISHASFTAIWMLYIGNILFAITIAVFLLMYNKRRKENANTGMMAFAGFITTVMGIIIICALILIVYLVAPGVFNSVPKGSTSFLNAPPQMKGRIGSFIFDIFVSAIAGNISTGSFISLILPYAAKRNQKADTSVIKTDNSNRHF